MKLYNFVKQLKLDARSKIPLKDQLRRGIYQAVIDQHLPHEKPLPHPLDVAKSLTMDVNEVQSAYQDLVKRKILKKVDDLYHVIYKEFIYDMTDNYRGIYDAIELNGFTPHIINHPSKVIPKNKAKSINPWFEEESLYEVRVDYYGDDQLFAVTKNYFSTQLTDNLDTYLKTHAKITELLIPYTDELHQNYTEHAVIYPDWVSEAFQMTPGQAGLLIRTEYHNENKLFVHYEGYITNQYTLMMTHTVKKNNEIPATFT